MGRFKNEEDGARGSVRAATRRWWRLIMLAMASLAAATLLSSCGGGGDDHSSRFLIDISINGTLVSQTQMNPGDTVSVVVYAGESVVLEAGESVVWTMYAGSTPVPNDALVHYGGVDVQATTLSSSAVGITTFAPALLAAPVPITLIATSTYDSAEVGVDLSITN